MAEHNTLTGSSLHEAKQISTAGTSDAGKVITPSGSVAGTGVLRSLVETEITEKVTYIVAELTDISTASTTYVPMNFGGTVTDIRSVIHGALGTADVTLTCKISDVNITDGAITVTQSGSAAGDVDSTTPTAANTFSAGDTLEVTTSGASTNTVRATIMFTVTRS